MKYLLIKFDNEQYWLEVGNDGYAERQINIDATGQTHVSCLEDCLAEGVVEESDLDGQIYCIKQCEFEDKWNISTLKERMLWDVLKKQYPIGMEVKCKVRYSYPQGCILNIGHILGICKNKCELAPNEYLSGKITGYDEVNMWAIVSIA